jgi:hypothetical protein
VLLGKTALYDAARAWSDLADFETRVDDVLAARPDAFLVQLANVGTDRMGGGAFERVYLLLVVLGPDGLIGREEWFDADRDAAALARFDELTASLDERRRLAANRATMHASLVDAALATGDIATLGSLLAERTTVVDHTTGAAYGREGVLTSWGSLLRGRDPRNRHEPLATLGDSLALCRVWVTASGLTGATIDVGAYEKESIHLFEVDGENRRAHTQIFAANRLGDAIAGLYARWGETLPEGPARTRAAATARTVAAFVGPFDPDRYATTYDPAIVSVDHRTLGTLSTQGAEALRDHLRAWLELADGGTLCDDAILALRPDALLVRRTFTGTDRATGGVFERQSIHLKLFGDDGRVTRFEHFDADRDAEALARFDELMLGSTRTDVVSAPACIARRVPPNRASASIACLNAALAARDAEAVAAVLADECDLVDYTLGKDFERREVLSAIQFQLTATTPTFVEEALATLGDSLVLTRWSHGASGLVTGNVDMGPYQSEFVCVVEVDAQGRRRRVAVFPATRLGDAIAYLYERYAEVLPAGPAQTRAAARARTEAAFSTPFDLERLASAIAPTVEVVDQRILGTWTSSGAEALLRDVRSLVEMTEGITYHVYDVLDLRPDAILERAAASGISAVGGGAFERPFLLLRLFGADGRQTRHEYFDVDQVAEARARFDELTAAPPKRRVVANAATAAADRMAASTTARDVDALSAVLAEDVACWDHTTGTLYDRAGYLATFRMGLKAEGFAFRHEVLASLGDSLALYRSSLSASRFTGWKFDVGPYERERLVVTEVDGRGLVTLQELFEGDRLGEAIVRLYQRHAERLPDGPERARATAIARTVATVGGPLETYSAGGTSTFAPDLEFVDHRRVGLGPMHGADSFLRAIRTLLDLADDVTNRIDDVLALRPDAHLMHWTNIGRDRATGGEYERPFLLLWVLGPDGRVIRGEQFDLDREDEALARFEELTGGGAVLSRAVPRPRVRPNAATAVTTRFDAAIAARDVDALGALFAESGQFIEHPTGGVYDREGFLFSYRSLLRAEDPWHRYDPLATLGNTLTLARLTMSGSRFAGQTFDVGPFLREDFALVEVDASGRQCRGELFGDRLGDAIARLYERYAAGLPDGPARARAEATARAVSSRFGPLDIERYEAGLGSPFEVVDHRTLPTWSSARGGNLQAFRSLLELVEDVVGCVDDVLDLRADALLVRATWAATDRAGGGRVEWSCLTLWTFGSDGLNARAEMFDENRDAEALARFDELTAGSTATPDPLRIPPNAATRASERYGAAIAADDRAAQDALCAPDLVFEDRRHLMLDGGGRDMFIASSRYIRKARTQSRGTWLATAGDRLALNYTYWWQPEDVSPFELETIALTETDADGRIVTIIVFDGDARRAASLEMLARYARSESARWAPARLFEFRRALNDHDLEGVRAALPRDFFFDDHTRTGLGRLESAAEYVASLAALYEGSPDAVIESLYDIARSDRGVLAVTRRFGTLAAGGPFESVFLALTLFEGDRLVGAELFELEDLDAARARFDALAAESAA